MGIQMMRRSIVPVLGSGMLFLAGLPSQAAGQHLEKHFAVKGRPVVVIHNVANGRIEVKSWKNAEVDVVANQASNKIGFDVEQAGDRVDVIATILDTSAQPMELEANLQLTVPEETELQLKTETGLIYVEQVMGDMTLESGKGLVEVRFSGNDSFDLNAQTTLGTVDNQAAAYLKPDSHGVRHLASKFTKGLFGTVGQGLAQDDHR